MYSNTVKLPGSVFGPNSKAELVLLRYQYTIVHLKNSNLGLKTRNIPMENYCTHKVCVPY
jgi:hypothetical protein